MTKYMYLRAKEALSKDSDGYINQEYAEKVLRKILLNGFDWANRIKIDDLPTSSNPSEDEFIIYSCYRLAWDLRNDFENFMEFISIYENDALNKLED